MCLVQLRGAKSCSFSSPSLVIAVAFRLSPPWWKETSLWHTRAKKPSLVAADGSGALSALSQRTIRQRKRDAMHSFSRKKHALSLWCWLRVRAIRNMQNTPPCRVFITHVHGARGQENDTSRAHLRPRGLAKRKGAGCMQPSRPYTEGNFEGKQLASQSTWTQV